MADTDQFDVVAAAKGLSPLIKEARDEIEDQRQLPQALVEAMADTGQFRLYLPRSMGGIEADPITAFRVVEAISKIDGSTGWSSMIAIAGSFFMGWLAPDVVFSIFGNPPDVRMAGSFRAQGEARIVDGGYRVTGRWDFASGVQFSSHYIGAFKVVDDSGARLNASGTPETRQIIVPVASSTIEDNWNVMGMKGTGSHDIVIEDVFVPSGHSLSMFEPAPESGTLYHPRMIFIAAWALNAGNALGIAQGAMDSFIALATERGSTYSETLLADRPVVQSKVAEAEAIIGAARSYYMETVGAAWNAMCEGKADPGHEIALARLATTNAIRESVRAVDILLHAAGTNGFQTKYPIERFFRDIHVAVQHGSGNPAVFESAGKALMGRQPYGPGW